MYRKKMWLSTFLLLCFWLVPLQALTPLPPLNWHLMQANGSEAFLEEGDSATFEIVRKNRGEKRNPDTHGYAYLLSSAIALPPDWRKIVFEGRWWQEPAKRKNYEEMTMALFGAYPPLPHGKVRGKIKLSNYLEVSYDTWNRILRFSDMGTIGSSAVMGIRRSIPLEPTPFYLELLRDPQNSNVQWSFYEYRNGRWQRLYHQPVSRIFEETDADEIYWKIGGWCTLERPITTRLHFDRLSYRILNESDRAIAPSQIHELPAVNETRSDRQEHPDSTASQEANCMNAIPVMPGMVPAHELTEGLRQLIDGFKRLLGGEGEGNAAAYYSTSSVAEIGEYYRNRAPEGWIKKVDLFSPDAGGILTWESGNRTFQVSAKPEEGHVIVIIGCGRKR